MAAIAPITVKDGASTPVDHSFNPIMVDPATFRNNANNATPTVGQEEVSLTLKQGSNNVSEAINRATVTLRIPVLETPAGGSAAGYVAPPKVAYYLQVKVEALLPNRSTAAQRKDLRVMMSNLLLNSQVVSLIDTIEKPY